jgi:hypothetical protein
MSLKKQAENGEKIGDDGQDSQGDNRLDADNGDDASSGQQSGKSNQNQQTTAKQSPNSSGEATVELQSTSQQLRTPYAQRGAQHSQGGSEISRDEIPVALQTYVEQYFEQVRKQARK